MFLKKFCPKYLNILAFKNVHWLPKSVKLFIVPVIEESYGEMYEVLYLFELGIHNCDLGCIAK